MPPPEPAVAVTPSAALSAPVETVLSLDSLAVGACAVVGRPTSLDPTVLRLLEMGLTPGALVVVTRRAPWGDPIEVSLRGTRLCLRRADAARFAVRPVRTTP